MEGGWSRDVLPIGGPEAHGGGRRRGTDVRHSAAAVSNARSRGRHRQSHALRPQPRRPTVSREHGCRRPGLTDHGRRELDSVDQEMSALTAGTRLGPYEIQSALGAGGMGEVYKARDTRLDRVVAIKVLSATLASDPQFRERFDREARAISQLDHPHICTLHDVGEHNHTSFLVMQYLEGETLDARLAKGPLPLAQALQYALQIAAA